MLEYQQDAFLCRGADVIIHYLLPSLLTVHEMHAILRLMMRKRKAQRTTPESAKFGRVNIKILVNARDYFCTPTYRG